MRENYVNGGCGEVDAGVRRWVWGGGCGCREVGVCGVWKGRCGEVGVVRWVWVW